MIAGFARLARRRPELLGLAGFLLIAVALFVLSRIGSEIGEGEVPAFDAGLLRGLRASSWSGTTLRSVMLDLTAIGDNTTLILLITFVAGYYAAARRWATALYLIAATSAGALLTTALKSIFQRARPDIVEHLVATNTASFPSGHAMNSAVAFLTIAVVLTRETERRVQRVYLLATAVLLVVAIGASRVYLGVHWPTDVLAGWMVGACWAITCALVMEAVSRRATLRKAIVGVTPAQTEPDYSGARSKAGPT